MQGSTIEDKAKDEAFSCAKSISQYMIDPKSKKKLAWKCVMSLVNLTVFLVDPFIISFEFLPLQYRWAKLIFYVTVWLFVFDMVVVQFTASIVESTHAKDSNIDKEKAKKRNRNVAHNKRL